MKNISRTHSPALFAAGIALALTSAFAVMPAAAIGLNDLVDQKLLDQKAKEKLGVKTDQDAPAGGIPLVGNPSDTDEEAIGREIAGRLLGAAPLVKDDKVQQYVNKVGRYVAAQSKRPDLHWTFGVIESPSVNAFAAPGGYVFLTRGLYELLGSEAELAGVLGHEIGHVNARHHVKVLQKQQLIARGTDLLSQKAGSASVKTLVGKGAEVLARKLDKDSEFEADRLGVQYATAAGYDSYGLVGVLDRLQTDVNTDQLTLLFETHPLPAARMAALDESMGTLYDSLKPGLTLEKRLVKISVAAPKSAPVATPTAAPTAPATK